MLFLAFILASSLSLCFCVCIVHCAFTNHEYINPWKKIIIIVVCCSAFTKKKLNKRRRGKEMKRNWNRGIKIYKPNQPAYAIDLKWTKQKKLFCMFIELILLFCFGFFTLSVCISVRVSVIKLWRVCSVHVTLLVINNKSV